MPPGDICARCGQRPGRYWSYAVLGPVNLRETPWCGPCFEQETTAEDSGGPDTGDKAALPPEEGEEALLALGPIDWGVLRRCLPASDEAESAPADEFTFVADAVRRIAAHHGQSLPTDITEFVARHGSPCPPAT